METIFVMCFHNKISIFAPFRTTFKIYKKTVMQIKTLLVTLVAGTLLLGNQEAKYLMFFHGSGPLSESQGDFDKNASIGIAWSKDLKTWNWPGKLEKQ